MLFMLCFNIWCNVYFTMWKSSKENNCNRFWQKSIYFLLLLPEALEVKKEEKKGRQKQEVKHNDIFLALFWSHHPVSLTLSLFLSLFLTQLPLSLSLTSHTLTRTHTHTRTHAHTHTVSLFILHAWRRSNYLMKIWNCFFEIFFFSQTPPSKQQLSRFLSSFIRSQFNFHFHCVFTFWCEFMHCGASRLNIWGYFILCVILVIFNWLIVVVIFISWHFQLNLATQQHPKHNLSF